MKIITSTAAMQRLSKAWHRGELTVGLVPTMGALHDGHLSLVQKMRKHCEVLVVSIYVNPTQFGPKEDFKKYPRPQKTDQRLLEEADVDVLFHPKTLYFKDDSTRVNEGDLSSDRCGAKRPGHFEGVTTVVAKLFQIVQPHYAIFGQKDGQQFEVIQRMVRDLYFPVQLIRGPIVRDENGLALSSRNQYLSQAEYSKAVEFAASLKEGARRQQSATLIQKNLEKISGIKVEYVKKSGGNLYAAVKIGQTRLIDNRPIAKKAS